MMSELSIPMSFGEIADKISILEIKRERIRDPAKLRNVEAELAQVAPPFLERVGRVRNFVPLFQALKEVNRRLWDIEDNIRDHERRQDFGPEFVRLARSVYLTNDERLRAKRAIDDLFGSAIREEKVYGSGGAEIRNVSR
ncbi:MAG: hypothetical protein ACJ8EL_15635 [Rhizomicrobium sp.]|jgi:hypothetical protein